MRLPRGVPNTLAVMAMTPDMFKQFADQGYNRVPMIREVLADLETPLSAYKKLADQPFSYLLESVHGGEKWGRYSIIGLACDTVLSVSGKQFVVTQHGNIVRQERVDDPLHVIEQYRRQFRVPDVAGSSRFAGGLVGYFGYDCIRYIERKLHCSGKADPLQCPDILLMVSERLLVFDNLSGKLQIIIHADPNIPGAYDAAQEQLNALVKKFAGALPSTPAPAGRRVAEHDFVSSFPRDDFQNGVARIKDYIAAGDVMQVVLSQRLATPFHAAPLDLYRALRSLNPSPYMFYLNLGGFYIVGSSPEILVRLEDNEITVRPIAGTRPRCADSEADRALEQELLADPKERAEHLMLIDLGRNDTGRVAKIGSVRVTDQMLIERYSHVMHIVSNVTGTLADGQNAIDVLRATFPAGTVSGAPKIRAMEIIDELEPVKRGIYAGAVGYLSWHDNMDTAIAIRTAVIKDNTLYIQAGAGIVADSLPSNEWQESMNKGRAIFRAVTLAEAGLG